MPRNLTSVDQEKQDIFALLANALLHPLSERSADRRRDQGAAESTVAATPRKRGFFVRLEHWLTATRQRDVEAYLAKATDVYDLEARMRALERSKSYPF